MISEKRSSKHKVQINNKWHGSTTWDLYLVICQIPERCHKVSMKIKIRYEMRPKWKATSFLQKETSVYLKIQHQFRHLMLRHKTHVHVFFLMTFIGVQMRSCCYKIVKCYLMHRHNLIIFFFVPFIYDSSFMYWSIFISNQHR